MKKSVIVLLLITGILFLTGCKHTEVQKVEPIDLGPGIEILFDSRPDNNRLVIVEDIKTIDDIVLNSATYLKAWEDWEVYAESLEDYLIKLRDRDK